MHWWFPFGNNVEKFLPQPRSNHEETRMCSLEITVGPSKFDLMLALFDRKGSDDQIRFVRFAGPQGAFEVIISGVTSTNITEQWEISGLAFPVVNGMSAIKGFFFTGNFNTQRRKGKFEEI